MSLLLARMWCRRNGLLIAPFSIRSPGRPKSCSNSSCMDARSKRLHGASSEKVTSTSISLSGPKSSVRIEPNKANSAICQRRLPARVARSQILLGQLGQAQQVPEQSVLQTACCHEPARTIGRYCPICRIYGGFHGHGIASSCFPRVRVQVAYQGMGFVPQFPARGLQRVNIAWRACATQQAVHEQTPDFTVSKSRVPVSVRQYTCKGAVLQRKNSTNVLLGPSPYQRGAFSPC